MRVSVGLMAYNEEANIARLLEALSQQTYNLCQIIEIFVVASGCTDRTVPIAQSFAAKDPRIKIIEEAERHGKASAINLFLAQASGEILILESADTLPITNTCENLVLPFLNPAIGMTGAHPVPVNDPHHFVGYAAHFLWRLHHQLACHEPKLGEMVAFRHVAPQIPANTAVDEASLEAIITQKGFKLAYAPEALVLNKGPETLRDFLKQRRRIANGHLHLQHTQGYTTSTMGTGLIRQVLWEVMATKVHRLQKLLNRKKYRTFACCLLAYLKKGAWAVGIIGLEAYSRLWGAYDFHFAKRNPVKWEIAGTTKRLSR